MLKKCVAWLALAAVLMGAAPLPAVAQTIPDTKEFSIAAKGAVVIDASNGRVYFAQNANGRLPMASTTKIMTALLALEQPDLDEPFVVDSAAIRVEGTSMGLKEGDTVTLRTLAHGMLLPSGNDAANAAAVRIAGSKDAFAELMNEKARELGLEDTHYVTPSGLDADGHYSSAYDLAILAAYALENPDFREICCKESAKVEFGNPPYGRWLKNHNKLLNLYPYAIGVKTGYTDDAKRCLVTAAQKDGVTLIAVTLAAQDDFNVHQKLYERYFGELTQQDLTPALPDLELPVTGGQAATVGLEPVRPPVAALRAGERDRVQFQVEAPKFAYAPVKRGDALGEIRGYINGDLVYQSPLTAAEDVSAVQRQTNGLFHWIGGLFGR